MFVSLIYICPGFSENFTPAFRVHPDAGGGKQRERSLMYLLDFVI